LARAHATPLSSIMGAVRAAAEARTKGVGLSSGTAGSRAGRLHQMGAPLAETFSAGGRRWVGCQVAGGRGYHFGRILLCMRSLILPACAHCPPACLHALCSCLHALLEICVPGATSHHTCAVG
jgi:hypothetical protein